MESETLARRFRQSIVWLAAAMALYVAVVLFTGWDAARNALTSLETNTWLVIIGLSTFNFVIRFVRWQFYLKQFGYRIPAVRSALYFVGGFAFTNTPAKAGEAVRSIYLKTHGVGYSKSLAALFAERLTDLTAVVLLSLAAALAFDSLRIPVFAAAILILAFLPFVHSSTLHQFIGSRKNVFGSGRISKGIAHLLNLLQSSAALLRSGPLFLGMALSIIAALSVSIIMYVVLTALGAEISPYVAAGIYATGILAGALSFLPGGLGSAEAVMALLLLLAGIDTTTAIAAILICRIVALWYAVALGMLVVVGLEFADGGRPAARAG